MIDPSIPLQVRQLEFSDPLDAYAKAANLQQMQQQFATGQLAQQSAQLQLQEQRKAIADQDATRAALTRYYGGGAPQPTPQGQPAPAPMSAPAPAGPPSVVADPTGAGQAMPSAPAYNPRTAQPAPQPATAGAPTTRRAVPTISDLISSGVPVQAASGIIDSLQKADKGAADIAELDSKSAAALQDYAGNMANGILKSNLNPNVIRFSLSHAADMGPRYAQMANQIGQQIQQNPASARNIFQNLADASEKQRTASSAEATADAKVQDALNETNKTNAQLPGMQADAQTKQLQVAAQQLASAPSQIAYTQAWAAMPAGVARNFPDPAKWDAKTTPSAVLRTGMTPEQRVAASETASRDANTAAYQQGELRNSNIRTGIEGARLGVEQSRAAYEQQAGGAISDPAYLQGIVRGEIQINPRDKNFATISAAAKAQDPTWSSDRYNNRQHTTQSFSSGPDAKKMEGFNQVTSHLGELKTASDELGHNPMQYTPGMVANLSPTVKRYNDAVATAGSELATTLAQGQATQHEVETTMNNLRSGSPAARAAGMQQYTVLIGGRLRAMAKKYAAGTGDAFPVDQYVDSDAVHQLQQNGVDPYTIADAEKPHWMKAKEASAAPAARQAQPAPAAAPAPVAVQHMSTDDLFKALNK